MRNIVRRTASTGSEGVVITVVGLMAAATAHAAGW